MPRFLPIITVCAELWAVSAWGDSDTLPYPAAGVFDKADVLEHNGNRQNKHRLRHNPQYRKHCKEQHGVELGKEK